MKRKDKKHEKFGGGGFFYSSLPKGKIKAKGD